MAEIQHSATPAHDGNPKPELVVPVHPGGQHWELLGTRTQLDAEGVIPAAIAWPATGTEAVQWTASPPQFRLQRTRPEAGKGARRNWADCDWWHLTCGPISALDWRHQRVADARRELAQARHDLTPAGQQAVLLQFQRSCAAQHDRAFQAFKALVPGLMPAQRRGRAGGAER